MESLFDKSSPVRRLPTEAWERGIGPGIVDKKIMGPNESNFMLMGIARMDPGVHSPPHLVSPFTGGARVLPERQLAVAAHRRAWLALYAVGALIGLALALTRPNGWLLVALGLVGGAFAVFYTLPPFSLQYHGLGDVAVGVVFGPIVTLGSYAVQTGALSTEALLASLPLGILVAAFLFVNEMP